MKITYQSIIERLIIFLTDTLSIFYTEFSNISSVSPPIFLLFTVVFALLSSYSNKYILSLILLINYIVLSIAFGTNFKKLYNILTISAIFLFIFLSPFIIYYFYIFGFDEAIYFILNESNGLAIIFIRSILSICYLSMIPLVLGIDGLIQSLRGLGLSKTQVLAFFLTYRKLLSLIQEIIIIIMGRASRRLNKKENIINLWRNLAEGVAEFIYRGLSIGFMIGLGFKSRIIMSEFPYRRINSSKIRTSIYVAYSFLIIMVSLYILVIRIE